MSYDIAKLRKYMQQQVGQDELDNLLFDYFPTVRDEIPADMVKSKRIKMLLTHCRRRGRLPDLVAALERQRGRDAFNPDDFVTGRTTPPAPAPAAPPVTRNPRQIFISHANQDAAMARRLADDLEAEGYAIWMAPDSIRPGEKWAEAIGRGLDSSGLFVLLMSPQAVASRWVNTETNIAIELNHEGEMQLYPLLLRACRVPALWRAYQRISLLRGGYDTALHQLLAALAGEKPAPAAPSDRKPVPKPAPPIADEEKPIPASKAKRPSKQPAPAPPADPDCWLHPKSGLEMVRVPAGEFLYGDDKETVYLDEFWIAKTPVTNGAYARFVAETGHKPPQHWKGKTPPAELVDHPVVYVHWKDAEAYAKWAGVALPTQQQWEKAARGTDGREYPWGDWRDNHCNPDETGIGTTTPVGQFSPQGDSPYGCVDMSGNVWEWTSTPSEYNSSRRVLRGGSFFFNRSIARAANRLDYSLVPHDYGFRVVVVRLSPSHPDH